MRNLRHPVSMTVQIYSKVRIGRRGRCLKTAQYKTTRSAFISTNAVSLQPTWSTTAAAQHSTHPKNNITHYAGWRPTRTTSFCSCQTAAAAAAAAMNSTLVRTSVPVIEEKVVHDSTSARGRWRRKRALQHWRGSSMTRRFLFFP